MEDDRAVALLTDSCCDLPPELLDAAGVEVLPFPYTLDGSERLDDFGRSLPFEDFYAAIESGAVAHTSQVPLSSYFEAFERLHAEGKSVVLVSLSSGLSGTHDTSVLARERFLEEYPEAEIHCVDSLCVSGGQGLLVLDAARRLAEGLTASELAEWLEENRGRIQHIFTVDSFEHLVRGGRVSPALGMAGAMLSIKPVLHVDGDGRLVPLAKPRGRHRALRSLVERAEATGGRDGLPDFVVAHGDCEGDCDELCKLLGERFGEVDTLRTRTGVIVGTHTGAGILSVFFWGDERG